LNIKYEILQKTKILKEIHSLNTEQQEIINNYFTDKSSNLGYGINQEIKDLVYIHSLKNYSQLNDILKTKLSIELLNNLQKKPKKRNTFVFSEDNIAYVEKSYYFGNSMILLNNLLYYCEILKIKNIYLNSNRKWPISTNFTSNKINITFISSSNIDLGQKNIFKFDKKLLYFQKVFRSEIRIDFLKNEIKKNIPKIIVNKNDLYIHIRSGDIFNYNAGRNINYAQPPLCFYESILNKFKFRNIFILSIDKLNPVINVLIEKFPRIILTQNRIETDIGILSQAYNIVGSVSSFLTTLIIINDNLKNLWEYDNYRFTQKFFHLHHDIYKYPNVFKIFKMKSSYKYINEMFPWTNSKKQISLMLNEICNNTFEVIKPFNNNYYNKL